MCPITWYLLADFVESDSPFLASFTNLPVLPPLLNHTCYHTKYDLFEITTIVLASWVPKNLPMLQSTIITTADKVMERQCKYLNIPPRSDWLAKQHVTSFPSCSVVKRCFDLFTLNPSSKIWLFFSLTVRYNHVYQTSKVLDSLPNSILLPSLCLSHNSWQWL